MDQASVVMAGATGNLGERIARDLVKRGAAVRALVRPGTAAEKVTRLRGLGVTVTAVDFTKVTDVAKACAGGSCVISALAGLRGAIVDAQTVLLEAAVAAGVPRFIPSDFSIDFTKLAAGQNRNLDLRRAFQLRLDQAPIAATTVFNGAFADMLTGQAPIILFQLNRVLYWGDADQRMDFTTIEDTAAYTAAAALDPSTPRFLRIAGDQLSARELVSVLNEVTHKRFGLLRAGGLGRLETVIKVARALTPETEALYPPWQGMQYLRDMFSGRAKLAPLDNDRYPDLRWTPVREVLS